MQVASWDGWGSGALNEDKIDLTPCTRSQIRCPPACSHAHNTPKRTLSCETSIKRLADVKQNGKERKDGKDALMRLHHLLLATDGCRSLPLRVLKRLLVRPALPTDLKECHLFATAAWLPLQGYPRVRRSRCYVARLTTCAISCHHQ